MQTSVTNPIALGVIGLQKTDVLSSDFRVSAIPAYKQKIRVGVTPVDFTTTTFEAYLRVAKENTQGINYVDSLEHKPSFITLSLLDRVAIGTELQEVYNAEALAYLKSQKEVAMVSSVSMALPESLLQEINAAEAVFFNNGAYKQYQLSLVKRGKVYKSIDFTEATIFAYQLSFFCWAENDRKQIVLVNIIDKKSSCTGNSYRDALKALENMNYFKL